MSLAARSVASLTNATNGHRVLKLVRYSARVDPTANAKSVDTYQAVGGTLRRSYATASDKPRGHPQYGPRTKAHRFKPTRESGLSDTVRIRAMILNTSVHLFH